MIRFITSFSALLAILFGSITTWLALNGGSAERPALFYWVLSAVLWVLAILFMRAAWIGKMPQWFERFLDDSQ